MAVFGGITQAQTLQLVTAKLAAMRAALADVRELYGWTAGLADTDLMTLGFPQADADAILSAVADANAVAVLDSTGAPPATYPQPASKYVYAASRARVIGPQ